MTRRRQLAATRPVEQEIAVVVSELLAEIGMTWNPGDDLGAHLFDDLGFDSFDGYELIVMIEEAFGLEVDETDFARIFTVGEVIDAIASHDLTT